MKPHCLVNHALTGNSNVIGNDGWWNELLVDGNVIDTNIIYNISL